MLQEPSSTKYTDIGNFMSNDSRQTWSESLDDELLFWRRWLTEEEFKVDRDYRLNLTGLGIPEALFADAQSDELNILDVGSGPLSTLGTNNPSRKVNLILADPLGNAYNELLTELGFSGYANIVDVCAEDLLSKFSENSFDVVHSANALDHAHDPLLCLQNMLSLCKPGGWVYVVSVENEGERQSYSGLHQWNFTLTDDDVRLWNKTHSLLLRSCLKGFSSFAAKPVDHGNNLPMFELLIQKG